MTDRSEFPDSMVNPYSPPSSPAPVSADLDIPGGRPILASLFVFPAIVVGVILVFVQPPIGLAALVVTHIIDRRVFHGPPFL